MRSGLMLLVFALLLAMPAAAIRLDREGYGFGSLSEFPSSTRYTFEATNQVRMHAGFGHYAPEKRPSSDLCLFKENPDDTRWIHPYYYRDCSHYRDFGFNSIQGRTVYDKYQFYAGG